jgi:uncharacterized membrane protein
MDLGVWFLFLHILGAIIAFGPTFAFPIIGAAGGHEPMHANFATRVTERISDRVVLPLALFQAVTGAGLIITRGWDLLNTRWLLVAIVLYVIALSLSIFRIRPAVQRVIAMTSAPPPPGASGPPPELAAQIKRIQQTGPINGVLIVLIVLLMVFKPAF